jgi:hypothetical protein
MRRKNSDRLDWANSLGFALSRYAIDRELALSQHQRFRPPPQATRLYGVIRVDS